MGALFERRIAASCFFSLPSLWALPRFDSVRFMKSLSFSFPYLPIAGFLCFTIAGWAESVPPAPGSVSFSTLIDAIAVNHPELKFYESEIAFAKAGARSAASWNDPELSFDLGHKRVRDTMGAFAGEGLAWSVSVTQTFEWPGRLSLRKAIAGRQVELAEIGLARFQKALVARACVLAYGLHAANVRTIAIFEVADRLTDLRETFLARDPAGLTPLLETRAIEASELGLQRRATDAELALQAALIELNQLRGAAPDSPLKVAAPALRFNAAPALDVLLQAAHENNFSFKLAKVELEQQGYVVSLARNERYPAISVGPFFSQEEAGEREKVVGIGLSLPLPLTGRTRGAIDVAEARRRQAESAFLVARLELEREVALAAQAFAARLAEMRRWSPDSIVKFREAAELADRHYRLGAVSVATYIELQTHYLDAVEALLATESDALQAGLELQQLTGLDFNAVELAP